MQRAATALLLALVATCAAARPLGRRGVGRTLAQDGPTTWNVEWDVVFVPYPRVDAVCGDLVTFRWDGSKPQTVALVGADSNAAALEACSRAKPLTEPASTGEHTEELLAAGTYYFAEPSNCKRGQVLVVTVACDEVAAMDVTAPAPEAAASPNVAAATRKPTSEAAAPAPAPSAA